MSWARLDDRFHAHPKIDAAGNGAAGLFARALSYCAAYSTGGFVSSTWAQKTGSRQEIERLCTLGLWEKVAEGEVRTVAGRRDSGSRALPDAEVLMAGEGYFVTNFLHFNWTRTEAENIRLNRQKAGEKGGSATQAQARDQADAQAGAGTGEQADRVAPARHDPSRPVPTQEPRTAARPEGGESEAEEFAVPAGVGADDIPWGER